ncbi:M20/M25/M40 family metallo-hydrolase [Streptomyces sp. NPDC048172]|uniref:M20/M25/M40 family metallo-hydrolase n=1 Tax=Streptomyces sp. NPDC048172 TaxID=3365505 RepID=UPI00371F7922
MAGLSSRLALGAVVLAAVVVATALPGTAHSDPGRTLAERLERDVKEPAAFRHLSAFQRITDENGGERSAGSPAYAVSAEYVKKKLTAAGYDVRVQRFSFPDFEPLRETAAATGPVSRELHPLMAEFSSSTPEGGVHAGLAVLPGSGCTAEEYEQAAARGRIALVQGKGCAVDQKQRVAKEAGARLVLLNTGAPGADLRQRYFTTPSADAIPAATLSRRESEQLTADAATGKPVTLQVDLRGRQKRTRTFNLLADTPTGDPGRKVVVGAHLDGGREGPGIDDNATSAAMVLETALRLAPHAGQVRNQVRFAFWGAEERAVLGSRHYVESLSPSELKSHALNLNFETLGASNYARMVYDGDDSDGTGTGAGPPGSDTIEREFTGYFARRGLPTVPMDFDHRSDYAPFFEAGIPTGGGSGGYDHIKTPEWERLFGGTAGQYLDPCYHQTCDRIDRIDRRFFGQYGDAMAYVTGRFAQDLSGVGPR